MIPRVTRLGIRTLTIASGRNFTFRDFLSGHDLGRELCPAPAFHGGFSMGKSRPFSNSWPDCPEVGSPIG